MDFQSSLNFVLKKEGGYVNDPVDRGGETKYGISKKANPDIDVANLTPEKAADIYKAKYWDAIGADTLPEEMKLVAFDTAVQHGVGKAKQIIEASGGNVQKIIDDRKDLYAGIIQNDPSQKKFEKGWGNRLNDLWNQTPDGQRAKTAADVQQWTSKKMGDNWVLSKLADAGHADEIEYARSLGYTPADIVAKFGGQKVQEIKQAQSDVANQGAVENFIEGAKSAGADVASGGRQIAARVTGDDAELKRLQEEEIKRQSDPRYQAQQETTGTKIGSMVTKAAPYVAGAVATGGAAIPLVAGQAAIGALEGALTPTTGEGQIVPNVVGGAAFAGGGAAVGAGVGKLGQKLMGGLRPGAEATAQAVEREAAAARQGVTPTSAMLNDTARQVQGALPNARAAADDEATKMINRGLLRGIGQEGDVLTPDVVATARASIYKEADDLLRGVSVPADVTTVQPSLSKIVSDYERKTLPTYRSAEVKGIADDIVQKIQAGDMDAAALVQARKNIANNAWKADADTRSALKQIQDVVDQRLTEVAPKAKAALDKANSQWQHLQVIEKVIEKTNGQNIVSPTQLATAVKQSSRDLFQSGKAPYQELSDDALKLFGPSSKNSLAGLLAKTASSFGDSAVGAASILNPTVGLPAFAGKKIAEKLVGKLVSSTNSSIVDKLTKGAAPAQSKQYLAKALGVSGAAYNESQQRRRKYEHLSDHLVQMNLQRKNVNDAVKKAFKEEHAFRKGLET